MASGESWQVDGYFLSSYAHDIQTWNGLDDVPDQVTYDSVIPQRDGIIPGTTFFGPGRKLVSMIVSTSDATTGYDPTDINEKRQNYDKNLDTLTRIFYRRKLLDVRRTLSDGSTRQAMCRVVAGIQPSLLGLAAGTLAFELQLPYSFWQDVSNISSVNYAPALGVNVAEFADATAPMRDLQYVITGPITNAKVTDVETGAWFQVNVALAGGQTATLDAGAMTVAGSATAANVTHDGDARWLTLNPSISGALVNFEGSGTTGATGLQIVGKRKFLR